MGRWRVHVTQSTDQMIADTSAQLPSEYMDTLSQQHTRVSLYYGDHVHWATIITSTGALLGGLAIVIAFIQLGNQREDRPIAQISKIGVWTRADNLRTAPDQLEWQITLFIQNASELPVEVHAAELAIDTLGYKNVLASVGSEAPQIYADKRTGPVRPAYFFPGTIPPGHKWHGEEKYVPDGDFSTVMQPRISIIQLAITDAARRQWDMRPYRAGPPAGSGGGASGRGATGAWHPGRRQEITARAQK
jgi:hypothetical protein